jgi:hypothetical protein
MSHAAHYGIYDDTTKNLLCVDTNAFPAVTGATAVDNVPCPAYPENMLFVKKLHRYDTETDSWLVIDLPEV